MDPLRRHDYVVEILDDGIIASCSCERWREETAFEEGENWVEAKKRMKPEHRKHRREVTGDS